MVTVSKQSANGRAEMPPSPGTKSPLTPPRVERWADVPDYPGYRVKLWINHPRRLRDAFAPPEGIDDLAGEELEGYVAERKAGIEQALAAIVLEHNGWPDSNGDVMPQPSMPGFWDDLEDQHLANVVPWLFARRLIAARWGVPPYHVDAAPADEVALELRFMELESDVAAEETR
jgi:hypothetical protein